MKRIALKVMRQKAKLRLFPIHGDDWEDVWRRELKVAAKKSRLSLQISNMDHDDIVDMVYSLQEKLNSYLSER